MPQEFVTEQTWDQYLDSLPGWDDYMGYLHANKHLVTWIDEKLESVKSFDELKAELLKLRNERQEFYDFAYKNLPGSL